MARQKQAEGQRVRTGRSLYSIGITFTLCYSALAGVLSLQSSMNVEDGLGSTSVMVIFITSAFSAVLIVPNLIDFLGAKTAIVIGEFGFLAYIVANFYPSWYTLIPAAIFHGLTESAPWAGTSVYVSFLGDKRWMKRKSLSNDSRGSYIHRFFSQFWVMVGLGDLIGPGLASLILVAWKSLNHTNTESSSQSDRPFYNATVISLTTEQDKNVNGVKSWSACGAKDCPATYAYNSTEEKLEKFLPNQIAIYILLSLFVLILLASVFFQVYFLPRAPAKFDRQDSDRMDLERIYSDDLNEINRKVEFKRQTFLEQLQIQVKEFFLHLISPLHLLVSPLLFYYGLFYGYRVTEYTRAFVSCTVGVEQLGIAMVIFSGCGAAMSGLCTWIIPAIGRRWFMGLVGVCHITYYMVSLFWLPNPESTWLVYFIGALGGIGELTLVNLYQGSVSLYFKDRLGIAYSTQNCVTNLGISFITGWSTSLCVYSKIYIQIGVMCLSLVCIGCAEVLFDRYDKQKTKTRLLAVKQKSNIATCPT